jgi:hypothetical protein
VGFGRKWRLVSSRKDEESRGVVFGSCRGWQSMQQPTYVQQQSMLRYGISDGICFAICHDRTAACVSHHSDGTHQTMGSQKASKLT